MGNDLFTADFLTVSIGHPVGIGLEGNLDRFGNVYLGIGLGTPFLPPRGIGVGSLGPTGDGETESVRQGRINNLISGVGAAVRSPIGGIAISNSEIAAVVGTPSAGGGYNWHVAGLCGNRGSE